MRILIVDDDDIARDLLRNTLKQAGYRVAVAGNGQEALEVLRLRPSSMVISGWIMPGLRNARAAAAPAGGDLDMRFAAKK
jgi:CheY-like chemotaxis protein